MTEEITQKPTSGFGAMDRDKLMEAASRGGSNVPAHKRSFYKDHGAAAVAGRAGGLARAKKLREDRQ